MQPLLRRFIDTFQKAIAAEMDAMRRQLGPFEVPLAGGRAVERGDRDGEGQLYVFEVTTPSDKLVLQAECTLRVAGDEALVTITGIDRSEVTLRCEREIRLVDGAGLLVIYPWFLYERLRASLESLADAPDYNVANALMLFGKGEARLEPRPLRGEHGELNVTQRQAVQLCSDSNLAFVWGPPGTGKTTTLGHIVTELLAQGQRILVTSTTNAAVDQALAKLAALPEARPALARGQIVRIGQASGDTCGAGLLEVVNRLHAATRARLERLRQRRAALRKQLAACDRLVDKLDADQQPLQLDLFRAVQAQALSARDLAGVFGPRQIDDIQALPLDGQQLRVRHRQERLARTMALTEGRIAQYRHELANQELAVVQGARVVLATMTNVYMSQLLQGARFDTVIVEEAGMAILPTLFYCASLARHKLIMVGDPKQLPPIVQARDEYVFKAMGRNIFAVAEPQPQTAGLTVMLDVQYRMHPVIGNLVSILFYGGKLRHGVDVAAREAMARKRPFPGDPIVVLDTQGSTACETREGSFSRFNARTAQLCHELAMEAVRDGLEDVAIITPYAAQARLIRELLAGAPQVECQTVHRFQGGERDLVILDTVDTAPLPPGVLLADTSERSSAENLVNVSISRARGKLIVVADVAYFAARAPRSIISRMLSQAARAGRRVPLPH